MFCVIQSNTGRVIIRHKTRRYKTMWLWIFYPEFSCHLCVLAWSDLTFFASHLHCTSRNRSLSCMCKDKEEEFYLFLVQGLKRRAQTEEVGNVLHLHLLMARSMPKVP